MIILPAFAQKAEMVLLRVQIPQTSASTLGVQKTIPYPVSQNYPVPELSARAVLVKDLGTETILYQKSIHVPLPIASTTKIMTALVSSEYFKPNSILIVQDGAGVTGARVGLNKGEALTFRSLLYGMLLNSGNDAAYAIAENYPEGIKGFVSAMNQKAKELDLKGTLFDNPAGFDNPHHYSTASDLDKMTREALKNPDLSRIFATKGTEVQSLDKRYSHKLVNLNKLLSEINGVLGVKTGYTENAKENLVTLVERDEHRILTVVLGSDDRFGDSKALIEWAYQNFIWQ